MEYTVDQCNLLTNHMPMPASDSSNSNSWWLGGLLVERRTSVSQIRGSIPSQVAAV